LRAQLVGHAIFFPLVFKNLDGYDSRIGEMGRYVVHVDVLNAQLTKLGVGSNASCDGTCISWRLYQTWPVPGKLEADMFP
jgi:hypothetical protein